MKEIQATIDQNRAGATPLEWGWGRIGFYTNGAGANAPLVRHALFGAMARLRGKTLQGFYKPARSKMKKVW